MMSHQTTVESHVQELKGTIAGHDGVNVADARFARRVDDLLSVFYDDIGEISNVSSRTLFDLFVIKVLYVERRSTDAGVVDYLGQFLNRYLFTRELFPIQRGGRHFPLYLSDLLEETRQPSHFQNLFEAYQRCGDNSLFVTGIFPRSFQRRRRSRWLKPTTFMDRSYYVSTGKTFYRLASGHGLAEFTAQRGLLAKLSTYFEVYMDALNEMSDRYIMGFDMNLIADKMLDSFNLYRRTGDARHLSNARKYAALLKVDHARFPAIFRHPRRG
jgi:hypothetical protein